MNVLFFARRFYPDIGGVEKHVLNISELLLKAGHSITIVAESTDLAREGIYEVSLHPEAQNMANWQMRYISDKMTGKVERIDKSTKTSTSQLLKPIFEKFPLFGRFLPKKDISANISGSSSREMKTIIVYRMPKVKEGRTKKIFIWLWLLKHWTIMQTADIIHCHDIFFWYLPFRFVFLTKKVYTTFHGYESYPIPRKAIFVRRISEVFSHGNICVGDYLRKWYGTHPTFVTYGAISSQRLKTKEIHKDKNDGVSILLLGRLAKDIGVSVYLDAIRELQQKGVKLTFSACGDGPLRSDVEKLGKAYGFVTEVEEHIARADIIFAASYLSILEALKYNKTIISVYENPLKEDILRMTPYAKWITITNRSDEVASAIEHYGKHPERKEKKEVEQWIQQQTWENLTALYISLWKK